MCCGDLVIRMHVPTAELLQVATATVCAGRLARSCDALLKESRTYEPCLLRDVVIGWEIRILAL